MHKRRLKLNLLFHDLKGPLAVVETGIASLLERKDRYGSITERQERVLQRTLRNAKAAQALVNDLLEIGRAQNGVVNIKPVKLSDLITDVLWQTFDLADHRLSGRLKNLVSLTILKNILEEDGITLCVGDALWNRELPFDVRKTGQILRNLLSNAIKYRKRSIEFAIIELDGKIIFSVKDDGRGIPQQYHKKIFETYFQLDDAEKIEMRGHGIGLAGSLMLVEELGGELLLESSEGKGATFIVKFAVGTQAAGAQVEA